MSVKTSVPASARIVQHGKDNTEVGPGNVSPTPPSFLERMESQKNYAIRDKQRAQDRINRIDTVVAYVNLHHESIPVLEKMQRI